MGIWAIWAKFVRWGPIWYGGGYAPFASLDCTGLGLQLQKEAKVTMVIESPSF